MPPPVNSVNSETAAELRGAPLAAAIAVVGASVVAPAAYTALALHGAVPMNLRVFLAWLFWLQIVHAIVAVVLWRRRAQLSTRMRAMLISWGGLAFWYWLPAPMYFVLTMNLDTLQLTWTAFCFFWEVPVVGGAFVMMAQWLFPSRRTHADRDGARRYRAVVRYPTTVAALLFLFTLGGYVLGSLQLRIFAYLPLIEQVKNVAHGLVISLLLAVYYHLALDRVLEALRARIAREHGLGMVVARTVAGRIFGVSLAVAVSGFALISLFVLQAFQSMVRDSAIDVVRQDLARAAAAPRGEHPAIGVAPDPSRVHVVVRAGDELPAAAFSPETRRLVATTAMGVVHDSRQELKVVGFRDVPRLGGKLVVVAPLTEAYGPLWHAAVPLAGAGGCVLIVLVGMLVFASRASTQAVRALSRAVRRVEAGQVDDTVLRIDTADEIGELSAVVQRYVRQSRDLQQNLEEKVRDKTHELSARLEEIERTDAALRRSARRLEGLQHIDRAILAAESPEAIVRAALPRLRSIVPSRWAAVLIFEPDAGHARVVVADGNGAPREGWTLPMTELPPVERLRTHGVRYVQDVETRRGEFPIFERLLGAGTRSLVNAPLVASDETIGLLCIASAEPHGFDEEKTEIVSEVANQVAVAIHQSRLREALDREQQRLHAVVEHLPEGVVLLGRDGRIALANPFGRAHISALVEVSPAGDVTAVGGIPLEQLLVAEETEPREIAVARPRPSVFQVVARRLAGPHGPSACVVVIRDVTREREAQKSAHQQARLAAVGQLAAGIAHDFNNILMTVINSAELAQRRRDDTAFVTARLEIIADQGQRAAALVRQILDFSRQSPPKLQPVDLGALVQQTVGLLERTLPETIRIVQDVPPAPLGISADPNQLSQVLTNLAVNARDAMAGGGELTFRVTREKHAVANDAGRSGGHWVVLRVRDTGSGMSPDVRERIFEPFFTTKGPGAGTGLGLSQAYGIVQQHGGHIAVESEPGHGTTFTLSFPAIGAFAEPANGREPNGLPTGNGETLLVVEDEPRVRKALAEMLGDLNYRVLTAGSAEEAMDLHAQHADKVSLVLSDLVMPGVGGVGLLRVLRARDPRLRIVMMTGYERSNMRDQLEGVAAWVEKPATPHTLGSVIRQALTAPI
jgi:signal transduction histidine kinase/HAMP domain-containing protein